MWTRSRTLLPFVAVTLAACGDDLGPRTWEATVDTVTVYSLARAELQGLPAGLDIVENRLAVIEGVGTSLRWDVALSETESAFVLLPPGAFPGIDASAGVAEFTDRSFEELERAPADTAAYTRTQAVTLRPGPVYVVRSRPNPQLRSCVYFAKLHIVDTDPAAGTVRLAYTRNPFCNDRALVPGDRN